MKKLQKKKNNKIKKTDREFSKNKIKYKQNR